MNVRFNKTLQRYSVGFNRTVRNYSNHKNKKITNKIVTLLISEFLDYFFSRNVNFPADVHYLFFFNCISANPLNVSKSIRFFFNSIFSTRVNILGRGFVLLPPPPYAAGRAESVSFSR